MKLHFAVEKTCKMLNKEVPFLFSIERNFDENNGEIRENVLDIQCQIVIL